MAVEVTMSMGDWAVPPQVEKVAGQVAWCSRDKSENPTRQFEWDYQFKKSPAKARG